MSGKSALLIGGTGAVGKHLLAELLASNEWTRVGEYGRRLNTPPSDSTASKLQQKIIDFDDLGNAGLKDGRWDVVFVTLGTSRALAGSAEQFEKIDREYVVRVCEAARTDDPVHEQRVVYLSSAGANASSSFLYPKSKGLTELGLANLGYADTIVFRPGFLRGAERPQAHKRLTESALFSAITGAVAHFSPHIQIQVPLLAKSMNKAGALGSSNIPHDIGATKVDAGQDTWFTVLGNQAAAVLGNK